MHRDLVAQETKREKKRGHIFILPSKSPPSSSSALHILLELRVRALLLLLPPTHTVDSPSSSSSSSSSSSAMAFPFNSGAGDNPNSNNPSPSLLREVREAFKKLAVSEYTLVTPFRDMYSFDASLLPNPPSYNFPPPPSFNSKEAAESAADSRNLDEKLEQLKLKALSFKQKLARDRDRISSLMESNRPFLQEFKQEMAEFMRVYMEHGSNLPNERIRNEIDTTITGANRAVKNSSEVLQLDQVLTNSRFTSLYEIMGNLSEIKKGLQKEVWDELNEDLMKAVDMEKKGYVLLAEETLLGLGYM